MDPRLEKLVEARDEIGIERAYFDNECEDFFPVDWGDEDEQIIEVCGERIPGAPLMATRLDDELVISQGERSIAVRMKDDVGDRHRTLCALNDLLAGAFELRFIVCSHGCDTLGVALLSLEDWQSLERRWPTAVAENFLDPRTLPNLIDELTEELLPPLARARFERMMERNSRRRSGNT